MHRTAIALLSAIAGLLLTLGALLPGPAAAPIAAAAGDVGYADFSYSYSGIAADPTGEKPQSKLWYNDGRWWGSLFDTTTGVYRIYWLNLGTQQWTATTTALDPRPKTKADTLWDGQHLYVVSGGDTTSGGVNADGRLFRYSYNTASDSYSLDFGPITVRTGTAETIVLDKDSAGQLWVTYTQGNKVYVNHSQPGNEQSWATPFIVPAAGANPNVGSDDISSLVAYDGKIGVLWSNQSDKSFYFAYHVDGAPASTWTGGTAAHLPGQPLADDHISLKSLQADPAGNLFAIVKTSESPPRLLLLAYKVASGWSIHVVTANVNPTPTRPIRLIDPTPRQLHVIT
jgi:hypothetical protein